MFLSAKSQWQEKSKPDFIFQIRNYKKNIGLYFILKDNNSSLINLLQVFKTLDSKILHILHQK